MVPDNLCRECLQHLVGSLPVAGYDKNAHFRMRGGPAASPPAAGRGTTAEPERGERPECVASSGNNEAPCEIGEPHL